LRLVKGRWIEVVFIKKWTMLNQNKIAVFRWNRLESFKESGGNSPGWGNKIRNNF